jgi:hypothetical protein
MAEAGCKKQMACADNPHAKKGEIRNEKNHE